MDKSVTLLQYVSTMAQRGACTCGRCVDAPVEPEKHQPNGHTSDVFFFKVKQLDGANATTMRQLIGQHRGVFDECDPLDGKEHSYIELGAWIGDQGLALMFMGLGELLGLWSIMHPGKLPGLPMVLQQQMAGAGLVSIVAPETHDIPAESEQAG
jgi:hypothetical protein